MRLVQFGYLSALLVFQVIPAIANAQPNNINKSEGNSKSTTAPWFVNVYDESKPNIKKWQQEMDLTKIPHHGIYEFTQFPNQKPTVQQIKQADKLVRMSISAAKKNGWFVKENAEKQGFHLMFEDNTHFVKDEFAFDDVILNPEKPEFLMYYPSDKGDLLVGIMYLSPKSRGLQIGGPLTLWHKHIGHKLCFKEGAIPVNYVKEQGDCKEGDVSTVSPEMLHVWFFDHPDGAFATRMTLSEAEMKIAVMQIQKLMK